MLVYSNLLSSVSFGEAFYYSKRGDRGLFDNSFRGASAYFYAFYFGKDYC